MSNCKYDDDCGCMFITLAIVMIVGFLLVFHEFTRIEKFLGVPEVGAAQAEK